MTSTSMPLHRMHLPLMVGALAAFGAFNQLGATTSLDRIDSIERVRAGRLVDAAQWQIPVQQLPSFIAGAPLWRPEGASIPDAIDTAEIAFALLAVESHVSVPLTNLSLSDVDELNAAPTRQSSNSSNSSNSSDLSDSPQSTRPERSTPADKLRFDSYQRASVPMPPKINLIPPARLAPEQRAIAQYISQSYRVAAESVDRFVFYAFDAARELRLDPHLLLAVMAVESSFNPLAESSAGAQGLMQVHTRVHAPKFAAFGGAEAAWDPFANIRVGARILADYLERYGDAAGALKGYVGAALLDSDGGYGSKVLSRRDEFEGVVRQVVSRPTTTGPVASRAEPVGVRN